MNAAPAFIWWKNGSESVECRPPLPPNSIPYVVVAREDNYVHIHVLVFADSPETASQTSRPWTP